MIKGIIFDLDGTLVQTPLCFDKIRQELQFKKDAHILETIDSLPEGPQKTRCLDILQKHEMAAAEEAQLMPGVELLLAQAKQKGLHTGIVTRNYRQAVHRTIEKLNLPISDLVTREDAPPKPAPEGLHLLCRKWELDPSEVLFVGDYLFDIEAGLSAGALTALYAPQAGELPPYHQKAHFLIENFQLVAENFTTFLLNLRSHEFAY